MVSIGSLTTSYYKNLCMKLSLTAESQSAASNETVVSWVLEGYRTDGATGMITCGGFKVVIDGKTVYAQSTDYRVNVYNGTVIASGSLTVSHDSSGKKSLPVYLEAGIYYYEVNVSGSQTFDLPVIPRASEITSAGDVTLGNACRITWTPKDASFRYKLKFSIGNWSYTTGPIHPNKTSAYTYTGYTIPLTVANQIPSAKTGKMTVTLYSYSDTGATNQIGGEDSADFTVTVPDNTSTRPDLGILLEPVSSLAAAFDGLYIQGKTKVKASVSAEGKYGATIESITMSVDGKSYDADDDYTSGYLSSYGTTVVTTVAKDSRGFSTTLTSKIPVLAYSKPKITVSVCGRCDASGNLTDSGTYLKIKATRSYNPVMSGSTQKNFCKIRYRYKLATASSYSSWVTILAGNNLSSNTVETSALLGGVLAVNASYLVQVQAIDDIGEKANTTVRVPTEAVHTHKTKNGIGFGKYCEGENLMDVGWNAHFHGEVRIGETGMTLKDYILSVINEGG